MQENENAVKTADEQRLAAARDEINKAARNVAELTYIFLWRYDPARDIFDNPELGEPLENLWKAVEIYQAAVLAESELRIEMGLYRYN